MDTCTIWHKLSQVWQRESVILLISRIPLKVPKVPIPIYIWVQLCRNQTTCHCERSEAISFVKVNEIATAHKGLAMTTVDIHLPRGLRLVVRVPTMPRVPTKNFGNLGNLEIKINNFWTFNLQDNIYKYIYYKDLYIFIILLINN